MAAETGLGRRIFRWLMAYLAVLTLGLLAQGLMVNEYVERLVWKSTMTAEMDHFIERARHDPDYRWTDSPGMTLYDDGGSRPLPPQLAGLSAGLHDDLSLDGHKWAVLVREHGDRRLALVLDIDQMERDETNITALLLIPAGVLLVLLGLATLWAVRWLVRPLTRLAEQITALRPERSGQRVDVEPRDGSELRVIGDAFNDYLRRNEHFVERERVFIDSASHELRTPIAVIGGATELALEQAGVPPAARHQLQRIQRTAREVEQLISLLLVLAKDPTRLASVSDHVRLDQLLPEIVDDHRHLSQGKDLQLELDALPACEVVAPLQIVQVAIGNLLRNAIENSDRGRIRIGLQADATVVIEDPGHGMSPEEISRLYAQVARGGRDGGGIGLDLISRLCEHLGWELGFGSAPGQGTRTTLRLG